MTERKGVVHVLQDRASQPPPLLYRYYAFSEWTSRIFQDNRLYFQSANGFNDPFDSVVPLTFAGSRRQRERYFDQWRPRHGANLSRYELLSLRKRFADGLLGGVYVDGMTRKLLDIRGRIGVYCMTEKKDHILMWSHYAGQHTGFCLEFQTNDPLFSNVHPVSYSSTLPCVNLLTPDWNEVTGAYAKALLTKAKEWTYEHEWRIIDIANGVGVRSFSPATLHGVILGCRIRDKDKRQVVKWCKVRSPRPILYEAREKKMKYGLDIESIGY
ncbi:MAG: DUF2971 domain-containing protein [Sedimentisphaerales bacterium]|nr:DUF2971 domain-containing protein [Sedimentisphaerales bacterium]